MRSFLRTNYAVRLNKGIERKIIFGALAALADAVPISSYTYVGMGAMWFMDFVMADRQLKIRKMISFELERADARRAEANAPLSCIRVRSGDAAEHLEDFPLERERTICWLDFDNEADDDLLDVVRNTSARMRSGSIIVVTVAARKPPHSAPVPREQWLRERFLNAVPATLPAKFFETESLSEYPSHLVRLLNETIHESVRVAVGRRAYRPLFSFAYRDGQAMATAGGIVVNKRDSARVDRSSALRMRGVGSDVTVLDVPLLTVREKAALDHLMPTRAVSERRARRGGVHLPADALASYARWYREYPIFAEIELR